MYLYFISDDSRNLPVIYAEIFDQVCVAFITGLLEPSLHCILVTQQRSAS